MVDPDRVRRMLATLDRHLEPLESLVGPQRQYSGPEVYARRYHVQTVAQICVDVAHHLIRSEGWRVPDSYQDAIDVLVERDVITSDLADRMHGLVGLRNRLVHLYEEVDDERVRADAHDGIDELRSFASAVARFLVNGDGS